MDTVTEATCANCGATYTTTGKVCPLCGTDPRHAVIVTALTIAIRLWSSVDECATAVLTALDAREDES